jgi:hypothetical protein
VLLSHGLLPPADVGLPPAPAPVVVTLVAGSAPIRVDLPQHAVTAPVVPIGLDAQGGLAVPDLPTTVGWWTPSALPGGSAGTTVLAGHVDSRVAGLGAFAVLRTVAVGDAVTVHGADGRTVGYRVVARHEYVKARLPVADIFAAGGPPRLVLITCGGAFDTTTRNYEDNVVVYAVPS